MMNYAWLLLQKKTYVEKKNLDEMWQTCVAKPSSSPLISQNCITKILLCLGFSDEDGSKVLHCFQYVNVA